MPATSVLALPYPATTDPADVPADIKKLADRIEALSAAPLAYQEFTANVNLPATTEAAANVVVTAPALTMDGATPIIVEFFAAAVLVAPGANYVVWLHLFDGSASIGQLCVCLNPGTLTFQVPVRLERKLTPSAGSHTFSIRGRSAGATGTVVAGAGGAGDNYVPGFVRIRRA